MVPNHRISLFLSLNLSLIKPRQKQSKVTFLHHDFRLENGQELGNICIPAHRRLRQEDWCDLKTSLGYIMSSSLGCRLRPSCNIPQKRKEREKDYRQSKQTQAHTSPLTPTQVFIEFQVTLKTRQAWETRQYFSKQLTARPNVESQALQSLRQDDSTWTT